MEKRHITSNRKYHDATDVSGSISLNAAPFVSCSNKQDILFNGRTSPYISVKFGQLGCAILHTREDGGRLIPFIDKERRALGSKADQANPNFYALHYHFGFFRLKTSFYGKLLCPSYSIVTKAAYTSNLSYKQFVRWVDPFLCPNWFYDWCDHLADLEGSRLHKDVDGRIRILGLVWNNVQQVAAEVPNVTFYYDNTKQGRSSRINLSIAMILVGLFRRSGAKNVVEWDNYFLSGSKKRVSKTSHREEIISLLYKIWGDDYGLQRVD